MLDYNHLQDGTRAIIDADHVEIQETLFERIVAMCLSSPRVSFARVRVAKLDAIADCSAVGCKIKRSRQAHAATSAANARTAAKGGERETDRSGQGNDKRSR